MNAAEQAKSVEVASKIAAVVNLFKVEFPDAKSDLNPWCNDPETRELIDPDSIDLGFHFPGRSRLLQSRSILVQIRFHQDCDLGDRRVIGIELVGFDHSGKQWQLSTIDSWGFEGTNTPVAEMSEKLKQFLRQTLEMFN